MPFNVLTKEQRHSEMSTTRFSTSESLNLLHSKNASVHVLKMISKTPMCICFSFHCKYLLLNSNDFEFMCTFH